LEPALAEIMSPLGANDAVVDIRTVGLLAGVQVRDFALASQIAAAAPAAGLVLRALPDATLQISPPLVAEISEIEWAVDRIASLIEKLSGT
jgi:acetylornithine/succinyldiaminopimelate/putrescine aminotransferase